VNQECVRTTIGDVTPADVTPLTSLLLMSLLLTSLLLMSLLLTSLLVLARGHSMKRGQGHTRERPQRLGCREQ